MFKSIRFLFLTFITVASLVLGPVTPVLAASLPAEINKQFTPLQIDAGGTSVLRISIFNPNTFALTNVAFVDNLLRVQPGLFIDTPNGVVNTCGGTVTATSNSTTISLANGGVPRQIGSTPGQCYIEVNISSITAGSLINTIPAHNPPTDIGLTANGIDGVTPVTITNTTPASATITVIAVSPPSLTKSFAPNTIFVGDTSVLTIRLNNNDVDTNLTGATYTDTLPTGLEVSTPANITRTNCGAGSAVSAPSGGTTITLSSATITPSLDCVVTLNVRGVTYGPYTNSIPAGPANPGSLQTDQGVTNGSPANAPLNVQPVGVTKLFSPTTIDAGDTTNLTITLQNPTNTPQAVTRVLDTLPANLTVVGSPSIAGCGPTASVVYNSTAPAGWDLTNATIPASVSPPTPNTCTITAVLQADLTASGSRTNTIPANSVITGTPGFTNFQSTSSTVNINPALTGTKAYASPFAIALGGTNLVTITLFNNSSTAFTDVDFTDTLPGATLGDLTVSNVPTPPATTCVGGTMSNTATSVTLTNGTIAANSSCTITFYVTSTVPASGTTYENTIPAANITACTAALGCVGNNSNIVTGTDLTVVNAPQLPVTVAKSFSPSIVAPGQASRLRLTITAPLDVAASQINITDLLPLGMVVAPNTPPIPAPTDTCPGGILTANPGDTSISFLNLVGDTLAAGTSCNIDVYVVAANPGSYDNLVPANTVTTSQGRTNSFDSNTANLRVTSMNMSKAFYPTTVQANGVSTLTITLENTSTEALTNVSVTDGLPGNATNGIIVAPTPNASTTCGGSFIPNAGDSVLSLTGGTVPAQSGGVPGLCTINVDVQGKDSTPASQSVQSNIIPILNVSGDIVSLGVTVRPTAQAQADLTIRNLSIGVVKGFNPVLVYGGATSTMTVQLINPNSTALTGVAFTDNMALLSAGIILANPPDFNTGTCGGTLTGNPGDSSFSFSGGTILPNSSCSMTLSVVMNVNGNRTNRIPAGAVTTLSGVSSTQATEASLTNLPGVSVNKVFNPNPVQINQVSTLTINITNTSSIPVVNMGVFDNLPGTLPDGVEVASPPNVSNSCNGGVTANAGDQTITLIGGSIVGNGSCQISVDVVSTRPGLYVNTIPAGALIADGGVTNNDPATDSLTVGTLFSLGNRVWFDTNNNNLISSGELGADGVVVQLYAADIFGAPTGPVLDTQTTSLGGYYRFDNLPEGDYVVVIPEDNFHDVGAGDLAPSNPLAGYWSSGTVLSGASTSEPVAPDPDDDLDNTDNGTLQTGGGFTGAVISSPVTLGTNLTPVEPTNDDDAPVPNPFGESVDNRSNRTVDFGFYRTAIGNLVFVDANASNTFGGTDTLLPGAIVQLFASDGTTEINVGPDGIFGTDDDAAGGMITGSNGLYALSGLPEGDYIVRVTPPAGYQSTGISSASDVTDPDFNVDNNDNGIGTAIGPLSSSSGVLTMDAAETGASITVTNSTGTTNDVSVDFGFVSISYSLGNRVWDDNGAGGGTANDGVRNGGEPGIDGVTVNLYRDTDNNSVPDGAVIATTATAGGGFYRFDNLSADTYIVEVVPPVGYVSTVDAGDPDVDVGDDDDNGVIISGSNIRSNPVTLGPGSAEPAGETNPTTNPEAGEAPDIRSNRTVDFGFVTAYSLGNRVWFDDGAGGGVASDGVRNGGEPGIDGVTVNLYRDSNNDGTPNGAAIATTTTAAGGYYRFDNLIADTYIVEVVPPAGYGSTVDAGDPDVDVDDNDDNGVVFSGTNIRSNPVTLGPGASEPIGETDPLTNPEAGEAIDSQSNRTVDFGFVTIYSLGNRVWYDTNNNGSVDGGESGITGVRVELYRDNGTTPGVFDAGDTFVGFDDTDATGYYRFDNLFEDDYVVVIPADNFRDVGAGDTVPGNPLSGYLSSGSSIAANGSVSDSFGPDADITVLDNDDNGRSTFVSNILDYVSAQAVTLGPGSAEPTGEADPLPNPGTGEAVDNQSDRTVDFGFYRQQLSNQIFSDLNGDGMFTGADAPLAGAIVQLYAGNGTTEIRVGPDGILGTADDAAGGVTTGAGGTYLFSGLPAGDYIVKVTPPSGYSTIDSGNAGDSANPNNNIDNNDNGLGVTSGQVSSNVVTLTPGVAGVSTTVTNSTATTLNPSLDFGFVPLYSLGNRVWFDTDNNSAINGGEVGVNNVRVELYQDNGNGVYDAGDTFVAFNTTDASGYYRFDGLNPGNFVVLIPSNQFGAGGVLDGYWSSGTSIANNGAVADSTANDPDNDVDSDDNGITALTGNAINYVSSQAITLGPGLSEPINDNDPGTNPAAGEAPNNQSNRTVDFGFYRVEVSNQIFWDIDSNGNFGAGDIVLPGATVKLYSGDGATEIQVGPDGVLGTADDAVGGVTSDAADGTYLFSGLPAGNYIVRTTPPAGFDSTADTGNAGDTTTPNNNIDNNDNGVGVATGEASSNQVALIPGVANVSNTVTNGTGTTLNPSLDFGFVPNSSFEYSLGNRVWFDTDNNGAINGSEVGVANVRVDLYIDNGGTPGVYDAGDTFVAFTPTDASGYYRFDNLLAGNYVVRILPSQFTSGGPLDGYWSSGTSISNNGTVTDGIGPDPDTNAADSDDNGVTTFIANTVDYVSSRAVTLGPLTSEPVGETDALPNPGVGEEPDNQSNRTVDFGFYRIELSDQVFVDVNNDGVYNGGDSPLPGATVRLYASNGTTEINVGADGILGTADDAPGGMVTGAPGTYLFSGLPAGDYIVRVTPPAGYASTVDVNADTTTPNNNLNNNDNGIGVATGQVSSSPVSLIPGVSGASTTVTNSTGTTHNPSMDFGFNATNGFLKTILGTSETFTSGTDVTIGEIVTYQITIDLKAGTAMNNVVVTDLMDKGLAFVDCVLVDIAGTNATGTVCPPTVSSITDPGDSAANPANAGRQVVFNVGNIPAPVADSVLVMQYRAIVLDVIENQSGVALNNSATVTWTGGSLASSAPNVNVVEPDMAIDKTANPSSNVPIGTPIQFTLTVNHTSPQSAADSFDVVITDVLPANLEYIPCSVTYSGWAPTSPAAPAYCPGATNTLTFTWDTFPRGQIAVINFSARLVGTPATNVASIAWTSLAIDPGAGGLPQQLSIHNPESTERWYDPNDTVNVYSVSDSITINEPGAAGDGQAATSEKLPSVLPSTGFAPGVVTVLPQQPADKSYAATDVWLEIPSQGIKMPIVGIPLVDGDWDLSWLSQEAGWLNGTAFPGWDGNSALTGHVTLPNGKPGPFANLGSLKWGDKIIVHAYGETYIYEVRENRTIKPYSTSVLKHEEDAWLTLITCKTYIESTDTYADRTAVRAVLIKVQKDAAPSSAVEKR